MPRTLTCLVLAVVLTACAVTEPEPIIQGGKSPGLHPWLEAHATVAGKSSEEIVDEVAAVSDAPQTVNELYYLGLLNQQLPTYSGWIRARDIFRRLKSDGRLSAEQRELVGILEQYNQERINWHQRYSDLQQQAEQLKLRVQDSEQENALLQQKIQAITDLESTISTRKED